MFLAELAYNTVEEEIKDLELKQRRRDESLEMSQDELEKDKKISSDAPTESKKKNLGNLFEMKMQQVQNES